MTALIPGRPFPSIDLPKVGGGRLTNADFTAPYMTVLNVYRGLHCPRCKRQIADFAARQELLADEGVEVISISTDPQDRAEEVAATWTTGDMKIGYGLSIDQARALGLFVSKSIREGETDFFAESGVFMIKADGELWGSSINSFPFMRPTAEMILDAVDTAKTRDYPPRGDAAA
ncbi:MAG: redoxin domain-containing protein [Pseudomonadota bacterium]